MAIELNGNGPWTSVDGPDNDVVISCRARLARNIAGFPFVNRASEAQRHEIVQIIRKVLDELEPADGMSWIALGQVSDRERRLLVERHLISKNLAEATVERAVAISADETLSVMINEEDHLRMQALASGLRLPEVHDRINAIDDAIETRLDYAFSSRWGYLTACPTNVGTGIRFSVMAHLPALKITNEVDRVRRAAKDMHLAVRGYYGEGSESAGDFYQISNQVTLGQTEQELLDALQERILPRIVDYERQARRLLVERSETLLEDRVHRALGVLQSARLLGAEEAMKLLSRVRLGAYLGRLPDLDAVTVNRLFLQVQPAHLQHRARRTLSPDDLRAMRADVVRESLGGD